MRQAWGAIGLSALMMTAAPLAYGQTSITTDGSTGPVVNRTGAANTIGSDLGRLSGTNLFHSFSNFQLQGGNSATWQSTGIDSTGATVTPGNITNVINRVTAGSGSSIDGPINSNYPTADFFFVDPQGVAFGANAAVNVPAGFFVSTAQQMNFTNGDTVAMNSPTSTFSVATPESFGFLGDAVGDISFTNTNMSLTAEDHAVIAGRHVLLNGANINLIQHESVSVAAIGAAASNVPLDGSEITTNLSGTVEINDSNFSLLTNPSTTLPQTIRLTAGNFNVKNLDGNFRAFGSNTFDPIESGFVQITLSGNLKIEGESFLITSGNGYGGDISIAANEIFFDGNQTGIATNSFNAGNSGNILIEASRLTATNGGGLSAFATDSGRAGDIIVTANDILLDNGASVFAFTSGAGNGGDISLNSDALTLANNAFIVSNTLGGGDGGNITINANALGLTNGAAIDAGTGLSSSGDAGNVHIVSDDILIDGRDQASPGNQSGIVANSRDASTGRAGSVTIQANNFTIQNSGFVATNTNSPTGGTAGPISISLSGKLTVRQTTASTIPAGIYSISNGIGNGGDITVNGNEILLDGGIVLGSVSRPQASVQAGSLTIEAQNNLDVLNGGLIGTLASDPDLNPGATGSSASPLFVSADRLTVRGDGEFIPIAGPQTGSPVTLTSSISSEAIGVDGGSGMLTIEANHVELSDGGKILASTGGDGDGGTVIIRGRDAAAVQRVSISGNAPTLPALSGFSIFDADVSAISSDTTRNGIAGSIFITTDQLDVTGTAVITSAASSKSATGNFTGTAFAAEDTLPRSGSAGNVTINASEVSVSDNAIISSRTETLGRGGNVIINAPSIQLTTGGLIDASSEGAGPAADAGLVDIDTTSLSLNASTISTRAGGTQGADAGTINISTTDLFVQNGSTISASSTSGGGGNINIMFNGSTFVLEDSTIIASVAEGAGGGGNITIDNPSVFIVNNGRIIANTLDGLGGTITIDAGVILQGDGDFIVESTSGTGAVQVSSTNSAVGIEGDVEKDEQDVLTEACSDGGNGESSSFTSQVGLDGSRNANVGATGTNNGCAL